MLYLPTINHNHYLQSDHQSFDTSSMPQMGLLFDRRLGTDDADVVNLRPEKDNVASYGSTKRLGWARTPQQHLVGGLEHDFYDFPYNILGTIIPTDELIFFRGVKTTNQTWYFRKGYPLAISQFAMENGPLIEDKHPGGSVTGVRKWSKLLRLHSEEPVFAFKTYQKKGPSTLGMTTLPSLQPQKGQPQLFLTLKIIERSIKFMWKCQWRS